MSSRLTIGALSQQVGLPTKTIRFYEEEGVITPAERAANGYRLYDSSSVDELTLIKQARDLGLPLSEIKKLMIGCNSTEECHHTQAYIQQEIDNYLHVLTQKIAQFKLLTVKMRRLKAKLMDPTECDDTLCCNLLRQVVEDGKENHDRTR